MTPPLYKEIRAYFNTTKVRIYQAYGDHIAIPAIKSGRFISPPFKMNRMTWIKPSFYWMMYRCGWGQKAGQERILAIDITREGFEWALAHSCLSHYDPNLYRARDDWKRQIEEMPVRIQWDPERDKELNKLEYRSIQIGLSGVAVEKYANEWIVGISDITNYAKEIQEGRSLFDLNSEKPYPLPLTISTRIGASVTMVKGC